ncbi:hypothetical protein DFH06DRAFT_1335467 [Mycena polygramma]|nr:hypothetical protein DFH06DRAFT_1335467 [Mycena polygramma]
MAPPPAQPPASRVFRPRVPAPPTPLLTSLLPTTSSRPLAPLQRPHPAAPQPHRHDHGKCPFRCPHPYAISPAPRALVDFPRSSLTQSCSPSKSDPQRIYHRRRRVEQRPQRARRLLKHERVPVQKRLDGERGGIKDESRRLRLPRSAPPSALDVRRLGDAAHSLRSRASTSWESRDAAPLRFYPPPTRSPQLTRRLARPSLPSLPFSFLTLTHPQPIRIRFRRADAQARLERLKIQPADSSSSLTHCG